MPENEFSSRNNGRDEDAAQNHTHLDKMTADELTDALSDMWDTMDENNYDPAQMDAYLDELGEREPNSPDFDVDASLASFQEKHAQLFEQMSPVKLSAKNKTVHRHHWRTSFVAAIVAVVMMLCSMMTAQAFGIDIFGAIARWTEETFHFSISTQISNNQQNIPIPAIDEEFATLQDALDAYGISEFVAPKWYPTGLKTVKLTATPRNTGVTIEAIYETAGKSVSVSIRQYVSNEDANIGMGTFEKDAANVTEYECDGITHYIMTNNSSNVVIWSNDKLVCSILGNLTKDELKQMINSIYEG